ncbi:ketopantoate reductase family protein [Clostridium intestinale]|uniref:2-dehydropantoate 2-reductase n=1 Tax=Clostridium intestinale DSM 6191 TaxID=1121320 RepID=A0A1M5UMT5_9CLOT|nr:2-dehydropantoate 2-reductase N-terminal domain-containing protein [Clostridium intestinale]SHH64178.1 2-dehydropantoate 2-reductase [Clostridium intestinale DSM 6191]
MLVKQDKILIFGAGVIGSIYAMKFIEAGLDVTIFARSNRFKLLKENGLQYSEKGEVKSIKVNVIDKLENDDVYDFIFVTVHYDQSESALLALKDNQSKNIVMMTNSSMGFSTWQNIVGDRILPAFPGFGGQIKDGILYARFAPKFLIATMVGEISGLETERIENLSKIFKTAKLPCTINKDMEAYLITHSISDIALLGGLYFENNISDEKKAHKITTTLKTYLRAIQKAGVDINPPVFKIMLKCPNFVLDFFFNIWLRAKFVKDMMLPDYASNATNEVVKLKNDLLKFLSQKGVTI